MKHVRMKNEDEVLILNTFGAPNFGCLFVEALRLGMSRGHKMGMLDLISQKESEPAQCDENFRVSFQASRLYG
jgi:hypothetical protein